MTSSEIERPIFWDDLYWRQFPNSPFLIARNESSSYWYPSEFSLDSGFNAPFGGIINSLHEFNSTDSLEILKEARSVSEKIGKSKIRLRVPPTFWKVNQTAGLNELLRKDGWSLDYTEIDQVLEIKENYLSLFNRNRIRDLRKAEGIYFEIENFDISEIFDVITSNREYKNVPQNLTLEKLELLQENFPNSLNTFLIGTNDKKAIAAAITLRVDSETLYVMQWGDVRELQEEKSLVSPMSKMAALVLNYAYSKGYKYLYLGSSTSKGSIDKGLLAFKQSLGAEMSNKLIWSKNV